MPLYDAWLFKSEEWQRRPLGLHPDAESALAEAKENHPDVVSVELAAGESERVYADQRAHDVMWMTAEERNNV